MKVRALKDNHDKSWEKGVIMEVTEAMGKILIDKGFAEDINNPKPKRRKTKS